MVGRGSQEMTGMGAMSCHDFQHDDAKRIDIGGCCTRVEFRVGKTLGRSVYEPLLKDASPMHPSCSCFGTSLLVGVKIPARFRTARRSGGLSKVGEDCSGSILDKDVVTVQVHV